MPDYKYEVAFSQLGKDEGIALRLKRALAREIQGEVFVASESQKDLVATDGVETLSAIYGNLARVVVVLYRPSDKGEPGWGDESWTQVECGAITARFLRSGLKWLVVVSLAPERQLAPVWYGDVGIVLNYPRYGEMGAIVAILEALRRTGGEVRRETAIERATRIAAAKKAVAEHVSRIKDEGSERLKDELGELREFIERNAAEITRRASPMSIVEFPTRPVQPYAGLVVKYGMRKLTVFWEQRSRASIEGGRLVAALEIPVVRNHYVEARTDVREFSFTLSELGDWGWTNAPRRHDAESMVFFVTASEPVFRTTHELGDELLQDLVADE